MTLSDAELDAYLRAARVPGPDADAGMDRVRARLQSSLAGAEERRPFERPASRASALQPRRFGWIRGGILAASGFVAGFAVHATVAPVPHAEPADSAPMTTRTPRGDVRADEATLPPAAVPSSASVDVEALPPAPPAAPSPASRLAPSTRDDLAGERLLVEMARSALIKNDVPHALDALDRHEALFPKGQLREERESLRVGALVAGGRIDEARVKVARFHRLFPGSLQGPAMDTLVAGDP